MTNDTTSRNKQQIKHKIKHITHIPKHGGGPASANSHLSAYAYVFDFMFEFMSDYFWTSLHSSFIFYSFCVRHHIFDLYFDWLWVFSTIIKWAIYQILIRCFNPRIPSDGFIMYTLRTEAIWAPQHACGRVACPLVPRLPNPIHIYIYIYIRIYIYT